MNDTLNTKTVAIRFILGLIGGLGSLAASFLLYKVFTSPEDKDTTPTKPQVIIINQTPKAPAKPRDPQGRWPEDINKNCRVFLDSCYKGCVDGPKTAGESEIRHITGCKDTCWKRRLELEDARLLCKDRP